MVFVLFLRPRQHRFAFNRRRFLPLQDVKACVDDLNSLLKVEPKNSAALKLLQDVQKKK